jgi:uncharacterized protein (UPF0276 family)
MSLKLCCNYLSEVKELFEEGKINFVDYFKLYSLSPDLSPLDWCIKHRDVIFHGFDINGSSIGNFDFIQRMDIPKIKNYIKKSRTPYLSAHICVDYLKRNDENEVLNNIVNNVKKVKEIFGLDIILENVPYRDYRESFKFITYPDFISDVVNTSGAKFLFDISHARVGADSLKMDFNKYVEKLPMDKVVEMHLAGTIPNDKGILIDKHTKMLEEDYVFLENAIKNYKTIKVITLEYGPVKNLPEKEIKQLPYPVVSFDKVNQEAKSEVYEQLIRLKQMLGK